MPSQHGAHTLHGHLPPTGAYGDAGSASATPSKECQHNGEAEQLASLCNADPNCQARPAAPTGSIQGAFEWPHTVLHCCQQACPAPAAGSMHGCAASAVTEMAARRVTSVPAGLSPTAHCLPLAGLPCVIDFASSTHPALPLTLLAGAMLCCAGFCLVPVWERGQQDPHSLV